MRVGQGKGGGVGEGKGGEGSGEVKRGGEGNSKEIC